MAVRNTWRRKSEAIAVHDLLPEPEPADSADQKLLDDIHKFGVHVVHIPAEDGTPGWTFSIGLYRTHGSPEVVVFGLPQDVAQFVINDLASRATKSPLAADQRAGDLIEGFECVLKPVDPVWYRTFVGYAVWYYGGRPFPLLQCFWPDREHLFPWEAGFRPSWLWAQPLLFHSEVEPARAEELLRSMGRSTPA
jgi:hypothetical protein